MKLKKFEQQPKHVDNIPIEAINLDSVLAGYVEELDRFLNKVSNGNVTVDDL